MRPIIQTKKQQRNGSRIFIIFALLSLIFFSASPGSFLAVSSWLNMSAVPFWNVKSSAKNTLPSLDIFFRSKTSIVQENENLRQQITVLTGELKGYDFAVQENIELKKLFVGKKNGGVFAGILARPGTLSFDTFLLDIGSGSGIKNGDVALSGQDIVLGKIIETYPYSAKVKAFSSSGEVTDAFLGPENVSMQLKGTGGGSFMAELPRDIDVKEGDAAVFPGSDGFILAYVESKKENLTDSFQKLYLRSPVNIFELKHVQILPSASTGNE
jgi:cell shape-determining protein MreC